MYVAGQIPHFQRRLAAIRAIAAMTDEQRADMETALDGIEPAVREALHKRVWEPTPTQLAELAFVPLAILRDTVAALRPDVTTRQRFRLVGWAELRIRRSDREIVDVVGFTREGDIGPDGLTVMGVVSERLGPDANAADLLALAEQIAGALSPAEGA